MSECADYDSECPVRLTLSRIADKWTVLIVRSLVQGTKRFGELRKEIEGVSQKVLTQTLRGMERDGLIHRKIYPTVPPKVEYKLTNLGKSLIEIFLSIETWSNNNFEKVRSARKKYDKEHGM